MKGSTEKKNRVFSPKFMRKKGNKMSSKVKTLNICVLHPNWKWIHDDVILEKTKQLQILINSGHINHIICIICVFFTTFLFGSVLK